jgi:hypothetical protein
MYNMWHNIIGQMNTQALEKTLNHLNINRDEFLKVYESFNYKPFSVEEFIYQEEDFVSEAMPKKLIEYVKNNNLNIDTSALEKCLLDRDRMDIINEEIFNINYSHGYGYTQEEPDLNDLYCEEEQLYHSVKNIKNEVLKIKELCKLR